MQWKGLWHLFARHGEVKRAFIAKKLSRGGKRFGFVSFGMESDASRAMERLNGFSVYGYRLTVKLANHYKWRVSGKHYHDQINKGVDSLRQPRNNQTVRGMYQRESAGEWEESGRESSRKLPKIIGENDNKSVEEKEKLQVSDLGLNTRSWVDVVSAGIQDKSTCVGGPSQKVGQEYSTEMVRVGENDLGLSAKEGVGVLKDKEVETIRVELDRAEVNHHEWAKEGD
ncbi:hypothetical protein V6N11_064000 [Hibiscus sabdariffa]|uniref:RRM domain-containing protein n=1 Tax=Hibiscus sabdariffa TaxID=183260 RepID=A0ABR2PMB7_9ROSI